MSVLLIHRSLPITRISGRFVKGLGANAPLAGALAGQRQNPAQLEMAGNVQIALIMLERIPPCAQRVLRVRGATTCP